MSVRYYGQQNIHSTLEKILDESNLNTKNLECMIRKYNFQIKSNLVTSDRSRTPVAHLMIYIPTSTSNYLIKCFLYPSFWVYKSMYKASSKYFSLLDGSITTNNSEEEA